MSETKWTPGPWIWNEDRFHGGWSGLFGAEDKPVVYPQRENDGDDGAAWFATEDDADEEGLSVADMNLIAAAPELYALLDEFPGFTASLQEKAAWAQRVIEVKRMARGE